MKKIVTIILVVLVIGGVYFIWNNRYKYFFKGQLKDVEQEGKNDLNTVPANENSNNLQNSENTSSEESLSEIGEIDCNHKCENRKNTPTYDYCREVCGFNEEKVQSENKENPTDCETLNAYDKDVCYKREAILQKKAELCKKIQDKQLRENCNNRVTEELIP